MSYKLKTIEQTIFKREIEQVIIKRKKLSKILWRWIN